MDTRNLLPHLLTMMDDIEKKIRQNVLLAPYTTFRIGGAALFFVEPENLCEYKSAILWATEKTLPFFVLGGGANILIHDKGYRGLVIGTKRLNSLKVHNTTIWVECGVEMDALVEASLEKSLSGLEFAAGLPGTVGGALFMNARAYGGAFSGIVQEVCALKVERQQVIERVLQKGELELSYKKSLFQKRDHYAYSALLRLQKGGPDEIRSKIEGNRKKRRELGQYSLPNAGCIFKNNYDTGKPTGKIIEELGLKGERIGDAEVYSRHANFIVNRGNALASDVYALIRKIEASVYAKTGLRLEREITLLGPWEER